MTTRSPFFRDARSAKPDATFPTRCFTCVNVLHLYSLSVSFSKPSTISDRSIARSPIAGRPPLRAMANSKTSYTVWHPA
jgi:hypothetical protein